LVTTAPPSRRASGRVVITSTEGRGTPFLRYDIGDVAV
jgi:phenylacetate-coenzyme A ligase PaaK-like adenylate-forming protein